MLGMWRFRRSALSQAKMKKQMHGLWTRGDPSCSQPPGTSSKGQVRCTTRSPGRGSSVIRPEEEVKNPQQVGELSALSQAKNEEADARPLDLR
jgi:hypothetical protein